MRTGIISILLISSTLAFGQPGKKPVEKKPSQSEIDKMMEDATKGMSEDDKAEMKKMMGSVMPAVMGQSSKMADYPEFTSNKQLVPQKNAAVISALAKKKLSQADIVPYTANLYNKIMLKGNAAEMAIVKKVIAQTISANDISGAAIIAMQQGHPQAAIALSMKAVQADPSNPNYQNNMASMLTQYGYPEQAVPVLQKLRNDFRDNSTVMNNLAHAWLGLGEIDSAKAIIRIAGGLNPYHPETKETEGVIEETTGNPVKAAEDYEASMENAINPFTEQLIKNNKGGQKSGPLDFEKLKRSITIYEYFPKDWIKIPVLSDNVSGYESDMRIKNGYSKMFEVLDDKIKSLSEASEAELNALMEKGEETFAKEMMNESMKGINTMSKPAVSVMNVLQYYLQSWAENNIKEYGAFREAINAKRNEMTKSGSNDKCPDFDRKNNEFLKYANPLIRDHNAKRIETFRTWLNAFCTWVWYITGNPKNSVMAQCIAWTSALEELYKTAVEDQEAIAKSCVKQNSDAANNVTPPEIPNFSCPTLVKMPMGSDWQELSNNAKNFDDNIYAIKKVAENPVPNNTIAYGADHNSIAEPGVDPFFKSANGSITPGIAEPGNSPAEQLLDVLTNGQQQAGTNAAIAVSSSENTGADKETKSADAMNQQIDDFWVNYTKNKIARQKELDAKNKEITDFWTDYTKNKIAQQKELAAKDREIADFWANYTKNKIAEQKALREAQDKRQADWFKEYLKSKIAYSKTEEYKKEMEKATAEKIKKLQHSKMLQDLLRKLMTADCNNVKTIDQNKMDQYLKDLAAAGDGDLPKVLKLKDLQPSLSNGLQAPGTFTPVKGLFQ